jgi:hypothetical protein
MTRYSYVSMKRSNRFHGGIFLLVGGLKEDYSRELKEDYSRELKEDYSRGT